MLSSARIPIANVVSQHVEDAAVLRNTRTHLVSGPHVKLLQLGRLDERLAAHLDGIAVASALGTKLAQAELALPSVGAVFVVTLGEIGNKDVGGLDKLFALSEALPEVQPGLISAFGWVSAQSLQGTGTTLLSHKDLFRKRVVIAGCAMHRADPGAVLDAAIASPDNPLRAQALRCVGELGHRDLLSTCIDRKKRGSHKKRGSSLNAVRLSSFSLSLSKGEWASTSSARTANRTVLGPDPGSASASRSTPSMSKERSAKRIHTTKS